ncbi:MAG: hypothetical protein JAZ15_14720 [Candidatus Thiodiazotropha endolucinida]|nr:hypothetical protein [Candidatus Thiodiazotropha taylori]MCW4314276.1 hypothetical protein [Candidatus Thiodiazotropha taylori]
MAKRWQPNSTIGKNEAIGRRLFDEPMLIGATDQPKYEGILLRHFEENRDNELSVDRLGQSGINKKVKKYLQQRATNAAKGFHKQKSFNGWIFVQKQALELGYKGRQFPTLASPITDGETEIDNNIYHAHISLSDNSEIDAFYLKHIFTTKGKIENSDTNSIQGKSRTSIVLLSYLRSLYNLLRKKNSDI